MLTSEMFKFVEDNMDIINTQVSNGDTCAINLGLLFNMNVDMMDRLSLEAFEKVFLSWKDKNEDLFVGGKE